MKQTDAELDALYADFYGEACAAHVETYHLHNAMEQSRYIDFWNYPTGGRNRNYATGLGPEAHAEAQEAGRLQQEYERSRSEPREYITRGGRK